MINNKGSMNVNVLDAYISYTGDLVAIAQNSYFIYNYRLATIKLEVLASKIRASRQINSIHWREIK